MLEKNLNYIAYNHREILLLGVYPYLFYKAVVEASNAKAAALWQQTTASHPRLDASPFPKKVGEEEWCFLEAIQK